MPLDLNSNPDAQILYEVDGTSVFREGLDVIAALLLGDPGTEVHLHLRTKSMSVSNLVDCQSFPDGSTLRFISSLLCSSRA